MAWLKEVLSVTGGRHGELSKGADQQHQVNDRTSVLTQHTLLPELWGALDMKLFPHLDGQEAREHQTHARTHVTKALTH